MRLEITKEKVLEAAKECNAAKQTLKTLFPEAFEDKKYFDLSPLKRQGIVRASVLLEEGCKEAGISTSAIQVRVSGDYARRAFYLSGLYNWELIEEAKMGGAKLLLITKK